jgi:outer membrane biosynthesis protein TonB
MRGLLPSFALLGGLCSAQIEITGAQYSEEARIAGLEGSVVVDGIAGSDGTVSDVHVIQPLGLGLDEVAARAVLGYDEARVLNVIGRAGEATVTFDIDGQGLPGNFKVDEASEATCA